MNSNHEISPATMPALPVDVMVEILYRLPVKTLLRFRCLSKQFRSIIDDPHFVSHHLQYHPLQQRLILVLEGTRSKLLLLDLDSVDNAFKLELPFENWGNGFLVIGSCDGLLALSNYNRDNIGLWNISTKKHCILPQCLSDCDDYFGVRHEHGFGRDAATDDYKLVRILNFFRRKVTEVSVYSLKGNCWRRIDDFPHCRYYFLGMAALVEGTLNWVGNLVEVEDRRNYLILSFDLKKENFVEMSLPDTMGKIFWSTLSLVVLGGCLGFLYAYRYQPVYNIWVMKEYGLKDSWIKLYSFSYENPGIPPIPANIEGSEAAFVCSMQGDKILIIQYFGKVFQYDTQEKKIEIVVVNELQKYITSVSTYVESLISPYGNN